MKFLYLSAFFGSLSGQDMDVHKWAKRSGISSLISIFSKRNLFVRQPSLYLLIDFITWLFCIYKFFKNCASCRIFESVLQKF